MGLFDVLRERGFIEGITSEALVAHAESPLRAYMGFDPTADSLHLGHLSGIVLLRWFQHFGHTPLILLGGATGRIGDPKSVERPLLKEETLRENIVAIRRHFEVLLDFSHPATTPIFLNNEEWLGRYSFLDFLRDVGKHMRVNVMIKREIVAARLASEEGISFTEFSYQLLQAFDFYHLFQNRGVTLQIGGSDQWGNIIAGIELIHKLTGKTAYGLTFPLLTRSDGKKFGKTEGGAIWLSAERFSPYELYQYLYRIPDRDVISLMQRLTLVDMGEIRQMEKEMKEEGYIPNTAQKKLAHEVTQMLHGEQGIQAALRASTVASPGHKTLLDGAAFQRIFNDVPHIELTSTDVVGKTFAEIAVVSGLFPSKGEVIRLIEQGGGAYLNNEKVGDPRLILDATHLIEGSFLLLGMGKKKKLIIKIVPVQH